MAAPRGGLAAPVHGSGGSGLGGMDGFVESKKAQGEASAVDKPTEGTPSEVPAAPKTHRMVHYNGTAQLRVTSPNAAIDLATQLVREQGGFVEHLAGTVLTLRVPVAKFHDVWKALLALGDVISKSTEADDITDAYLAVDLRLQIATAALNHLIALLPKTRNEREKLDLLREIQRLTEEVDGLHSQLVTLASMADFSRITLTFVPHEVNENGAHESDVAALSWIRELSPFHQTVAEAGKKAVLTVPADFVRLKAREHFIAESADQAQIWASRRDNVPHGDDAFWVAALKTRLGPEFASTEEATIGPFRVLRLVDRSDKPYTYVVGVHVDGDRLAVVEIYYPGAEQEKRHRSAVEAALVKGLM